MLDIQRTVHALAGRLTAAWQRLSATQRLTLHGVGIVTGVLLLGGLAGSWGPRSLVAEPDVAAYTGTAARTQYLSVRRELSTAEGELEITRMELDRLERIVEFSKQYQVAADLAEVIYETALQQGIDPELAFRLVHSESRFQVRAHSHAGAIGLAQVQLATARYYDPTITADRLYDPATNVRIGLGFLRDLIQQYGDVELALLAYNWGPTRLKELLAEGRNPRNGYASSIMKDYVGTR
jgi:soluble lytic murein transglycosylase-like protein